MESNRAYPHLNIGPEPHAPQRVQETPVHNTDNMGSYHAYPYFNNDREPQVRRRVQGAPVRMDFPQTYVGHQMHDQQDLQYSGGLGGLEGGHHRVKSPPFHNTNSYPPFQTTDPPESGHNEMGFGPNFEPQGIDLQPMSLPYADAVAPMPQVNHGGIADYMEQTKEQLKEYCNLRGIKTSRTMTKEDFDRLAQRVLPGVDCSALSKAAIRERCKAHHVATPNDRQRDSKAVMAQKLVEDDAWWGL